MRRRILAAAVTAWLLATTANAADPQNGRRLAERNCGVCHAVGTSGQSRYKGAPPFRELHDRYPMEMLAEALEEGMLTGHPAMPVFKFSARQIDDIIAYLKSVQTPGGRISYPE